MEGKTNEGDEPLTGTDDFEFAGEDNEETYLETSGSAEEQEFDTVCGAIEEILMLDEEFLAVQRGFCDAHYSKFEDTDENKMEYTGLFAEYTALMERTLEQRLSARVPGFDMRRFELQLIDRKDEIGGEIFDLLLSFSDFAEFKGTMLAHKQSKAIEAAGSAGGGGLSVSGLSLGISGAGIGKANSKGGV